VTAAPAAAGRRTPPWSLLLALPLAGVLLYLATRGVAWGEVLRTLRQGRPDLLALACLTSSGSLLIRALRWRIVLGTERQVARSSAFWATAAGYLGNTVLPARAGDLLRSVLLGRHAGLATGYVLATTLVERVADLLALVGISLLAILALDSAPSWLRTTTRLMGLLSLVALAGLVVLPRLEGWLTGLTARLPLSVGVRSMATALLSQVLLGMRTLQHPHRVLGFVGLTATVWFVDTLATIAVGQALGLPMTLPRALVLLAALGLASAVPSTPGYVGVYQFVAVTVLVPLGFSRDQALAQIIAYQGVLLVVVLVWGVLGLWRLSGSLGSAGRGNRGRERGALGSTLAEGEVP
jgi:uncharacterized protein (TIRG00374 family)